MSEHPDFNPCPDPPAQRGDVSTDDQAQWNGTTMDGDADDDDR